jgi:hypothetical protein
MGNLRREALRRDSLLIRSVLTCKTGSTWARCIFSAASCADIVSATARLAQAAFCCDKGRVRGRLNNLLPAVTLVPS